jgi:hypothetical protein
MTRKCNYADMTRERIIMDEMGDYQVSGRVSHETLQ